MRRILDVTLPLSPDLPAWPGEPHAALTRLQDMEKGDGCTVTRLDTVVHAGTHVDAPVHFVKGGVGIDSVALDVLMGPCHVAHVPDAVDALSAAVLDSLNLPECERLLFRTRNSVLWDRPGHDFVRDFVALTPDGAEWLVARGVRLVGVDYLSVERFDHAEPWVHRILLGAGIVAVEGLDLRRADPGGWDLVCLPLRIPGCDGAPARVVLTRDD